ncbi:MAG: epoxyqueuosine reductase QueH [Nanoarchaeota archaeon]|nr:epoxyqueuosine reductase QueH [Nanoarchaeota archaeon]
MKLLLHVCCGPCATSSIKRVIKDYDVICYFYNPCIEPEEEYFKRLKEFVKVCEFLKVDYVIGDYDNDEFRSLVKGREGDVEGGERCLICYEQRLGKVVKYAKENGFDLFTTTLTISPHKRSVDIFEIGKKVSEKFEVEFLEIDFKKKDGFNESVEMSEEMNLYRQNYCGCEFSKNI